MKQVGLRVQGYGRANVPRNGQEGITDREVFRIRGFHRPRWKREQGFPSRGISGDRTMTRWRRHGRRFDRTSRVGVSARRRHADPRTPSGPIPRSADTRPRPPLPVRSRCDPSHSQRLRKDATIVPFPQTHPLSPANPPWPKKPPPKNDPATVENDPRWGRPAGEPTRRRAPPAIAVISASAMVAHLN